MDLLKRFMNWRPALPATLLICIVTLYVGVLLNAVPWIERLAQVFSDTPGTALKETLLDACAVLSFVFFLLAVVSLAGNRVLRAFTTILVLFSAIASFYMTFYDVVIGYGVIVSLFHTDASLSGELLGWQLFAWLLPAAVLPLWLLWRAELTSNLRPRFTQLKASIRPAIMIAASLALVVLPLKELDKMGRAPTTGQEPANMAGIVAHRYLPLNWITGLALVAYQKSYANESHHDLFAPSEKFTYTLPADHEDLQIVFVIGETARSDHFGMLGYERNTTPLLAKEKNAVVFKGKSCDTATYLSLRCMFVREGGTTDDDVRTLKERNVFSTLRSLGFTSELYSTQSEVWFYNMTDTQEMLFREMVSAAPVNTGKPVDDMLLLPLMKQSVERHPQGKHLVILHTKGSHYLYSQRYPREFAKFTPECRSTSDNCSLESLINAYDNSILYTDYFLKQIIDEMRHKKAIVFYTSDHGESLSKELMFHATPRNVAPPEQFKVPMMVWMSDSLLATQSGKKAMHNIKERISVLSPSRHEEIFDSVMGCSGYTSPDGGINQKNNWCN